MRQEVSLYVYKHEDVVALEHEIFELKSQLQNAKNEQYRLIADLGRYHAALDEIKHMTKLLKSAGIAYSPEAFR